MPWRIIWGMYLRRNRRTKDDKHYEYWSLVESIRICQRSPPADRRHHRKASRPRQRGAHRVGRNPAYPCRAAHDRNQSFLKRRSSSFMGYRRYQPGQRRTVAPFRRCLSRSSLVDQARVRPLLQRAHAEGKEEIPWSVMTSILVLARFCAPSSELQIAESWYEKTALDDLLAVPDDKINNDRLYRALDALLPHKDDLCQHLQNRYGELFGTTFDFLFYDITSTYFEGTAKGNPQAKRGYSRDSRPDCPQVCIGLVATKEGLPIAFEIFDGNRSDVTTPQGDDRSDGDQIRQGP